MYKSFKIFLVLSNDFPSLGCKMNSFCKNELSLKQRKCVFVLHVHKYVDFENISSWTNKREIHYPNQHQVTRTKQDVSVWVKTEFTSALPQAKTSHNRKSSHCTWKFCINNLIDSSTLELPVREPLGPDEKWLDQWMLMNNI